MTLVYSCSEILIALDSKVTEYATKSLSLRDSSFVGEDTCPQLDEWSKNLRN